MSAWLAHATIVQECQRILAHVRYHFHAGNTDACGAFFELWFYRRAHRNRWFGVWPVDWNEFVIELLDSFVEKVHMEMLVAPERCWQCKLLVASSPGCHFCEILAAAMHNSTAARYKFLSICWRYIELHLAKDPARWHGISFSEEDVAELNSRFSHSYHTHIREYALFVSRRRHGKNRPRKGRS